MDFFDFVKTNKFIILFISIIANIILLGTSGYLLYEKLNYECNCPVNNEISKTEVKDESKTNMFVEVKGAVKTPGVFEVKSDNIINDVIKLAGGFTKDAYTNNINLSRKVSDELVVYVYTNADMKKKNQVSETVCNCNSYDISNCTENKQSEIVSTTTESNVSISSSSSNSSSSNSSNSSSSSSTSSSNNNTNKNSTSNQKKIININTATKAELTSLSGIGDAKAEDIINYRTQNGNFKSIDDIKNVKGIGDAIFAKIKDYITV